MLSDDELAAIEKQASAATPGPWALGSNSDHRGHLVDAFLAVDRLPIIAAPANERGYEEWERNGPFVAAARSYVPALVAEVKRLRGLVKDLVRRVAHGPFCAAVADFDRDCSCGLEELLASARGGP